MLSVDLVKDEFESSNEYTDRMNGIYDKYDGIQKTIEFDLSSIKDLVTNIFLSLGPKSDNSSAV